MRGGKKKDLCGGFICRRRDVYMKEKKGFCEGVEGLYEGVEGFSMVLCDARRGGEERSVEGLYEAFI